MNKYDVGGTESYANSSATVHGASEGNEGQFMVDGMAVDCGSAAGTTCNYADPFAYQEINYQIGNASAENMKGGIIYNMITRTGTNAFRGEYMYSGVLTKLQSNNITPELASRSAVRRPATRTGGQPESRTASRYRAHVQHGVRVFGTHRAGSAVVCRDCGLLDFSISSESAITIPTASLFMDDNRRKTYSVKMSWQVASASSASRVSSDAGQGRAPSHGGQSDRVLREPLDRASDAQRPVHGAGAMDGSDVRRACSRKMGASLYWGGQNIYPQPEVTAGDLPPTTASPGRT